MKTMGATLRASLVVIVASIAVSAPLQAQWSGTTDTGTTTHSGDVGIGMSTAPGAKLEVANGDVLIGYTKYLRARNSTAFAAALAGIDSGTFGAGNGVPNLAVIGNGGVNGFQIGGTYSGISGAWPGGGEQMTFHTNQAERMRIDPNGKVGIGTTAPTAQLDVAGAIKGNRHLSFMPWAPATQVFTNGYLRLLTPIGDQESNMFSLHIYGYTYNWLESIDIRCSGYAYTGYGLYNKSCSVFGTDLPVELATETVGSTSYVVVRIGTGATSNWYFPHFSVEYDGWVAHDPSGFSWSIMTPAAGVTLGNMNNVAITNKDDGSITIGRSGSATTVTRLTVHGGVNIDGNIAAKWQDVAEWVPATVKMSAGTVVVLNPKARNEVMPSATEYDTTVAGVVSDQPGVILGVGADTKAQIATTGRVKVHVDAGARGINIGDLLVTSNKPGVAMVSQPVELGGVKLHRPGTLIGKALEPLPSGEGDVLVLLSLQ